MRISSLVLSILLLLSPLGCELAVDPGTAAPAIQEIGAPVAKIQATRLEAHGLTRIDNYYWLREREDPEVLAYLEAENRYTEAMTAHTADLRESLRSELSGRIKQDDASVPYQLGDYFYYSRFETGADFPVYCRKRGSLDAAEQQTLDVGDLAQGHDYFSVTGVKVSRDQQLLAYASDTVGRRIYTLQVKDLRTGATLDDAIPEVTGDFEWANDNRTLLYTKADPETLRNDRVYRHVLGTDPATDVLVYEEKDPTFEVWLGKTKSREYLLLVSSQTLSDEVRVIDADAPASEARVLLPRERGHEYDVEHYGDHFYFLTNDQAENFRLVRAPVDAPGRADWEEVIPHREDVLLEDFEIFADHLVLEERSGGLLDLRVRPWDGSPEHSVTFDEPAYVAYVSVNLEFDTQVLRFAYSSLTTPWSAFDYDMGTHERVLLKQDEVLGGFDAANYVTRRVVAEGRDGVGVPVTFVHRRDTALDGTAPTLMYAYGSYGSSIDPWFSENALSLLDRGFVYAIAHVRGGEELGRAWYEDGKLLNKKHTFTDFIDASEFMVEARYADPDRLYAYGGSAGGLLIGAVLNMRPELFDGAIAAVPFVDVVTTMLDDSIPLTTGEYDEWGDPNRREYYDYMLSYSPYDNVEAKAYPALLVTTGLHDSQVQYWEPAKWVAKLRAHKTDQNPLLLRTDMSAGHGGKAGRLQRLDEVAFKYAFLLDLADIHE